MTEARGTRAKSNGQKKSTAADIVGGADESAPLQLPDLTAFADYRHFLNTIIENESATRAGLSMAKFAAAFGMSRSALSMILTGTRDLTLPFIHRIAAGLRLDHADHAYFEALVLKCQSEDPQDKAYYERKLEHERQGRRTQTVTSSSRTLVSEWFVPALLVYLIDVSDDPARLASIADKLAVSEQHLHDVIEALRREGFLAFKGRGNVHITFNRVAAMISSQQYMRVAFLEALRQLERHFDSPRHFFAVHSFSLNGRDIKALVEEYKALVEKYLSTTPAGKGQEEPVVVQLTTQLLPVL